MVLNDDSHLRLEHLPSQVTSSRAPKQNSVAKPEPVITPQPVVINEAPENSHDAVTEPQIERPVAIRPMWQIEREAIQQAIDYCDGNVLNAAVLLELSPSTVYRKKQAWEAEDEQQLV